jgi:predicted house-cleaning NTP pyrophosphatase (Maf/HAM1 superfamily)
MMPIRMELQALRASCVGRDELQSLRRELHEVMAGTEVIASNYASRADVSQVQVQLHQMETTILKWFVVTSIALAGLVFAGARLVH